MNKEWLCHSLFNFYTFKWLFYKSLLHNRYVRIFSLLISIAAHTGLIVAFGGVHFIDSSAHMPVSVTTVVELSMAGVLEAANPRKFSRDGVEKVAASADNMLSQTNDLVISQAPEPDVLGLASAKMQDGQEEISFLPLTMLSEPHYFPMNELSEMPQVILDLSPSLIFSLPNALAQLAVLRLFINEQGGIDQVLIDDSFLSESDQNLVIDTFLKTKFQPGKINGLRVKSQMKIEVRLDGGFDSQ